MLSCKNQQRQTVSSVLNELIMSTKNGKIEWIKHPSEPVNSRGMMADVYKFNDSEDADEPRYFKLKISDAFVRLSGRFDGTVAFIYTIVRHKRPNMKTDEIVLLVESLVNGVKKHCTREAKAD